MNSPEEQKRIEELQRERRRSIIKDNLNPAEWRDLTDADFVYSGEVILGSSNIKVKVIDSKNE